MCRPLHAALHCDWCIPGTIHNWCAAITSLTDSLFNIYLLMNRTGVITLANGTAENSYTLGVYKSELFSFKTKYDNYFYANSWDVSKNTVGEHFNIIKSKKQVVISLARTPSRQTQKIKMAAILFFYRWIFSENLIRHRKHLYLSIFYIS